MGRLEDLIAERDALDRLIGELRAAERARALSDIRDLMRANGIAVADLAPAGAQRSPAGGIKVAAKYVDDQGNRWSGRGLRPKWLAEALRAGNSLEDFRVRR